MEFFYNNYQGELPIQYSGLSEEVFKEQPKVVENQQQPIQQTVQQPTYQAPVNVNSGSYGGISWNINVENPNEVLDPKAYGLISPFQQNVAQAGADMAREMYLQGLRNNAQGKFKAQVLNQGFDKLVEANIKASMEQAEKNNQHRQRTNAGKLADMIANSQNNNNRAILSSLGNILGVKLAFDPDQYMSYNKMGLMNLQEAKQKEASDRAFQQRMAALAAARAYSGGGGGGGYSRGGGGGSSHASSGKKLSQTEYNKLSELVQNSKEKKQAFMDALDKGQLSQEEIKSGMEGFYNEVKNAAEKYRGVEGAEEFVGSLANDTEYIDSYGNSQYGEGFKDYRQYF